MADCTRTILSSSSSVKQDQAAGSYRFHCLLLHLPLSRREAYGVSLFSRARRSLEVIFFFLLHFSPRFKPRSNTRGLVISAQGLCRAEDHRAQRGTRDHRRRTAQLLGSSVLLHSLRSCEVLQVRLKASGLTEKLR